MGQRWLFQNEGRGWTGHGEAVTIPGRRNNFYKSLEKEVSEFSESQCQRSTVGGGKKVSL